MHTHTQGCIVNQPACSCVLSIHTCLHTTQQTSTHTHTRGAHGQTARMFVPDSRYTHTYLQHKQTSTHTCTHIQTHTNTYVHTHTHTPQGRTVKQMACSCVILDNDTVKCWGPNGNGQVGIGHANSVGNVANEMGEYLPVVNLGTVSMIYIYIYICLCVFWCVCLQSC